MPPALNIVPTDFAHYYSDGSGRDSYIHFNNGGLANLPHRFQMNLRGAIHNPNQVILLPSYGATTPATARSLGHVSLAQSAITAAARADPKARALASRQRQVSRYLTTAGNRTARLAPTPLQHAQYDIQPSKPQTSFPYGRVTRGAPSGSQTARSFSSSQNPYQKSSWNASASLPIVSAPSLSATYADAPLSARAYVEPLQYYQPVSNPLARSNFAETTPITHLAPQDFASTQQQSQQQIFQATIPQEQVHSAPAPVTQSFDARAVTQQINYGRTATALAAEKKWIAPTSPSFRVTLPKNSSYLDSANTHIALPNYNEFAPAGFSISAKLASKGLPDEHSVPLLA